MNHGLNVYWLRYASLKAIYKTRKCLESIFENLSIVSPHVILTRSSEDDHDDDAEN